MDGRGTHYLRTGSADLRHLQETFAGFSAFESRDAVDNSEGKLGANFLQVNKLSQQSDSPARVEKSFIERRRARSEGMVGVWSVSVGRGFSGIQGWAVECHSRQS
jgi:hypothetical protein